MNSQSMAWWPIVLGLAALYLPTYFDLAKFIWNSHEYLQSPLMLMVAIYGCWMQRDQFKSIPNGRTFPVLGSLIFLFGVLTYLVGRSQYLQTLEIGSQILILIALLLMVFGLETLKAMRMPLFFVALVTPVPAFVVDSVTMPMKMAVSHVACSVLALLNYPIAQAGVVLQVGPYQLLVADACAGLHTLISLEVLGLLYLYLVKQNSLLRNVTLAILIVPISFFANVIRVIVLILVTYHFGDAAGQSFIHQFAGIVLFGVALALIVSMDALLQAVDRTRTAASGLQGE